MLDAIHLKLELEFSLEKRAESFLNTIPKSDPRYVCLAEMLKSLTSSSPVDLLDIGCGKGRFIHNLISDGFETNITAMDISDKLFKYLPENCIKKVGNICAIPAESAVYDLVFCCEVLEHAVNIEAAIKELVRVCKPGGHVIVIDKDLDRKRRIRLEVWEQWFDKEHLVGIMKKNNMAVEIKDLSSINGISICAWIGKKVAHA